MFGRNRQQRGAQAEDRAADYLQRRGLRIVTRNYRTRRGEIDLIAEDGDSLVFVEVRARGRHDFGSAGDSIDRRKQQRLIAAALAYLQAENRLDQPCRFDVITFDGDDKVAPQWLQNAFQADTGF